MQWSIQPAATDSKPIYAERAFVSFLHAVFVYVPHRIPEGDHTNQLAYLLFAHIEQEFMGNYPALNSPQINNDEH